MPKDDGQGSMKVGLEFRREFSNDGLGWVEELNWFPDNLLVCTTVDIVDVE